jgi:hypothetical protein
MRQIAIPLALSAIVIGTTAFRAHDKVPEAVPDGAPRQCLPLTHIDDSHVRSDQVIDFVAKGGQVYRNTLPHPCPLLGVERRYSHRATVSSICSGDVITVLLNEGGLTPGPSCGLGAFQPVKLVKQ